jgi:hypothetical protein
MADKWAIHKGASKLAHSKGFASGKKHAALAGTAALAAAWHSYFSGLDYDFGK